MDWRHRAACRDEDPELFFPVGNSGPALLQIAEAKTVCRRCPMVSGCLSWALESGQDAGVWGGMSEDERRALKRRNAKTRAKAAQEKQGDRRDGVPLAIAGEGVMHEATARWHAPNEVGKSACSTRVQRPILRPTGDVPKHRRCRQPGCVARWAQLDDDVAVTHG
jgi:WhiB family redox-sensing transcriptional regulator